ncbi:heavy-metal-associated domain-containing protein [Devosia sediminis]|uniref:Heavy-metal-associated domain-containing protein n=1 Tax=Devosia sediminis TaxID=2798801 RepID=A0A934IXQ1_9HYPH|nr:heavy metal-associated domain-containing protein [Devosia sediminis]MBJ3785096.1 heavy-metal-associated domain-containing protein [Devosia sediminis]
MPQTSTFAVRDMDCSHCAGTVRGALEKALPGTSVTVDLAARKVSFTGDRAKGAQAIRDAGYTPETV